MKTSNRTRHRSPENSRVEITIPADRNPPGLRRRRGYILVWVAMLLVIFLGLLGIVIDYGLLVAQQRHVQSVSDAAALAAARDLLSGYSPGTARQTAINFIVSNGLEGVSTDTIYIPPISGPYAGLEGYVEVVIQQPMNTFFIQAIPGISGEQILITRAVAGYEAVTSGEGVTVLRPDKTGLELNGGGQIGRAHV